jgi:hypothetical protein
VSACPWLHPLTGTSRDLNVVNELIEPIEEPERDADH